MATVQKMEEKEKEKRKELKELEKWTGAVLQACGAARREGGMGVTGANSACVQHVCCSTASCTEMRPNKQDLILQPSQKAQWVDHLLEAWSPLGGNVEQVYISAGNTPTHSVSKTSARLYLVARTTITVPFRLDCAISHSQLHLIL